MTWTNTASYDWTMGEHSFNALLGMEAYRYEGTYIEAKNGMLKEGFDDWEHASLRYRQDGPLLTKNSWKVRKTGSTS